MSRHISDSALLILIHLEKPVLKRYKDHAGNDTIGVGHLILRDDKNLKTVTGLDSDFVNELTADEAGHLLQLDLANYEIHIDLLLPDIPQCMFDALVLFTFNIGIRGFQRSSVYTNMSKGLYKSAAESIMLYRYATVGGRKIVSRGLVKRRFIEASLLTAPVLRLGLVNGELPQSLLNEAIDIITDYYSKNKE